jgi:hypothetical protein
VTAVDHALVRTPPGPRARASARGSARSSARRTLAGLLATPAALALLAGCGGAEPTTARPSSSVEPAPAASPSGPAQESIVTTTKPTCSVVEHGGQRLGVTVPAGFMIISTPRGAGDFADSVNIVSVVQWREEAATSPGVVLVVYAYAGGEPRGVTALESSVRNFRSLVGAGSATAPVTAKPATVAGVTGSAGGETDAVAMDFQSPDGKPSPLHWWTVPTTGGEFVLAFGARDAALDARFAPQLLKGLKAGGC